MSFTSHTDTFVMLRANIIARRGGGLPPPSAAASSQFDLLPPEWVDSKEACESLLDAIHDQIQRLGELHSTRLVVRMNDDDSLFSSSSSSSRRAPVTDRDIDQLTNDTTSKFRLAESKLKLIGAVVGDDSSDNDVTIRLNVQRSLATALQQLSVDFRKRQRDYLQQLRQQQQNMPSFLSSPTSTTSGDDSSRSAFLLAQDELLPASAQQQQRDVRERDEEVIKIGKSVEELGQIFRHLGNLVIEQGTLLDRIDQNMDLVVDRTALGVQELDKAAEYKRSSRANYCVLFLTVLIFIFFVVLMNKLD